MFDYDLTKTKNLNPNSKFLLTSYQNSSFTVLNPIVYNNCTFSLTYMRSRRHRKLVKPLHLDTIFQFI